MNKLASPCCGSCENVSLTTHHCKKYKRFTMMNECCRDKEKNHYIPRNPIESKYQKMWEELRFHFIEAVEKKENLLLIDILEKMHKMGEEKHE